MSKSYAETYTMRSRFWVLLGESGSLLSEAFTQADLENQRAISSLIMAALAHSLIEHRNWSPDEVAASLSPDRLVSAEPDRTEGGEGAENAQRIDEPLKWFLRMMEAAGGEVSSTDYSGNPINVFCDDRGDSDDTFNLSETLGFTATSHDTSFDSSVTRLTAKGRAALSALKAPPTPAVEGEVTWKWGTFGKDEDGDPLIIKGQFGDYEAAVTLSRTYRDWSATINKGYGRLHFPSEDAAMAYAEDTVAGLLTDRLSRARETLSIYARAQQQGAVEVARKALEAVVSDCKLAASACDSDGPRKGFLHVANDALSALAALSSAKEPG